MKVAPACPCGQTYDAFRSERIRSYADAYHEIAWTRTQTSRTAVLRHWARSKAAEWAAHLDACAWLAEAAAEAGPLPEDGDTSFDPGAWSPTCDEWGGEPLAAPQTAQDAPAPPLPRPGRPGTQNAPQGRPRRSPAHLPSAPRVALPPLSCDLRPRDGKGTRPALDRRARGPPPEASPKAALPRRIQRNEACCSGPVDCAHCAAGRAHSVVHSAADW